MAHSLVGRGFLSSGFASTHACSLAGNGMLADACLADADVHNASAGLQRVTAMSESNTLVAGACDCGQCLEKRHSAR
jgi:hypothetical protein